MSDDSLAQIAVLSEPGRNVVAPFDAVAIADTGRSTMRSLRILVVEDDDLIAALLGAMLLEMDHDVVAVAATEVDAIAAAALHKPDLMIVDMQLRQGTGVAAVARVLEGAQMPHLFMSGARLRGEEVGAIVLQKPFTEKDLLRAIRRTFGIEADP